MCTYVSAYTENVLLHNIITERTRGLALPNKDASSMSTNALRIIGVRRRLQFFLRKRFLGGSHQEWNVGRHFEGG